jgi:hypothetical protein
MIQVHISKALDEVCFEEARTADLFVASVESNRRSAMGWDNGARRFYLIVNNERSGKPGQRVKQT